MLKQEDVIDPAKELFSQEQNDAHDKLVESGALERLPYKDEQEKEKARKKKEREEARKRKLQEQSDAIIAIAVKYNQSLAWVKLRLSQIKLDPINTLDANLENEQRIEELERELITVESLYKELLMSVDHSSKQMSLEEICQGLGISKDQAAELMINLTNISNTETLPLADLLHSQSKLYQPSQQSKVRSKKEEESVMSPSCTSSS